MSKQSSPVSDLVIRCENARAGFIRELREQFHLTETQADHVLKVFKQAKAVKPDPIGGRYNLTHGAFWSKPVIKRALAVSLKK